MFELRQNYEVGTKGGDCDAAIRSNQAERPNTTLELTTHRHYLYAQRQRSVIQERNENRSYNYELVTTLSVSQRDAN